MISEFALSDVFGDSQPKNESKRSKDWDEVNDFCEKVYMPYTVESVKRHSKPNARLQSVANGEITLTCFGYGTEVHLKDFDPDAGNILVLTTLKGVIEHGVDRGQSTTTTAGESFVADCSQTDYWLTSDADHLQLNLTIPHSLVERTAQQWFGRSPDSSFWRSKVKFGGQQSTWMAMLNYLINTHAVSPNQTLHQKYIEHLEQTVCLNLLQEWSYHAGIDLSEPAVDVAPYYLSVAEAYMREHVQDFPTLVDVATAVGVSVRTLSAVFTRYRQISPGAFLRELRLEGAQAQLLCAAPTETVANIASEWGYLNFGYFAKIYQQKFHELPSTTLAKFHYSKN